MCKDSISREYVVSILDYDKYTGTFKWRERSMEHFRFVRSFNSFNAKFANKDAGSIGAKGYVSIKIGDNIYKEHRLAWLIVYGEFPDSDIDHINGVKSDNRICNLREATNQENSRNRGHNRNNTHGIKGISWNAKSKKWHARIGHDGKLISLGYFATSDEAKAAYDKRAEELHGRFARL